MKAPWQLKKDNPEKMLDVLYQLVETIRYIAILLQPFVPDSAKRMLEQLIIPEKERKFACLNREFALKPGQSLQEPKGVFPRM